MKVIFLDFDGVLNSVDNMNSYGASIRSRYLGDDYDAMAISKNLLSETRDKYGQLFDDRCVRWLEYIISSTGAKIVVSSTWRMAGLSVMKEMWKFRKLPGEIVDVTQISQSGIRGDEIGDYLDFYHETIEQHVVIDDDVDDLFDTPNVVQINCYTGIMSYDADKIIKILNKE